MHHILVTELESSTETTCKITNLPSADLAYLKEYFKNLNIPTYCLPNKIFEVDERGVELLTKLNGTRLNYRVVGQSMAIEHTAIGGGTVKVQKLIWTLAKQ